MAAPSSLGKVVFVSIILISIVFLFGPTAPPPPVGQDLLTHEVSRSHKTTHHSR
jgi:hypothetical protein